MNLESLSFVLLWLGVAFMTASSACFIYCEYCESFNRRLSAISVGQALLDFAVFAVGCAIIVNAIHHCA